MKQLLCVCTILAAGAAALASEKPPTVEDARKFIEDAERQVLALSVEAGRADWVKSTYITDDTETLAAKANERAIAATVALAKQSTRFDKLKLPADVARKMKLLKLSLVIATPADPKEGEELTRIVAGMEGTYGKGKYCPDGKDKCLSLEDITRIIATSRDEKELLDLWRGWHLISRPMKTDFQRYVALANKGARELGFADNGAMWRAKYDMPPDAFAKELDRLWEQVRPLYVSLHAYVRSKLREKYGDVVPAAGPIPAHLLGNMWAQDWENIYPLVAPGDADPGYDLTQELKKRGTDWKQMVTYGESFFTSLGFDPHAADVLGAVAVREAARPRGGVPCQRMGRGRRERSAAEDVHRCDRRGLRHHPPRTGPQHLPARLQHAAVPVPRQRQRRLP